jgi:hypothetical protein
MIDWGRLDSDFLWFRHRCINVVDDVCYGEIANGVNLPDFRARWKT